MSAAALLGTIIASKSRLKEAKSLAWPENLIGSGLFSLIGVAVAAGTSLKVEFKGNCEADLLASLA